MTKAHVRLGTGGRVVIPAALRKRLGLRPGDRLTVRLDEHGVGIESRQAAVRAAQRMLRERVAKSELLTERLFESVAPRMHPAERSGRADEDA